MYIETWFLIKPDVLTLLAQLVFVTESRYYLCFAFIKWKAKHPTEALSVKSYTAFATLMVRLIMERFENVYSYR